MSEEECPRLYTIVEQLEEVENGELPVVVELYESLIFMSLGLASFYPERAFIYSARYLIPLYSAVAVVSSK